MDRAARGMLDVARSVLAELDLEVVLERVLESARDLTGARYAALGVLGESGNELERFLTLGIDDATREGIGELPRGRGVLGELIANPAPLRLAQVGRHPRSYGFPAAHPPMTTFLGVPILVDGRPYGNLYLTEKEDGREFDQADEDAVLSAGRRSNRPDALGEAVDDAIELLRQEVSNLRALITDLRPAALDDYGITGAIEALVARVARQGIEVDLQTDLEYEPGERPTRYPAELEAAVYRIVQEALTNAVKHGRAEHARLEIRDDETAIRVVVEDDGVGFDPSSSTDGFGLLGMRERVELFGGSLEIDSTVGGGTTVSAVIPVPAAETGLRQSG